MADTFTTTLNLTKPEVGASADTWGTKLNDNLDDIDALFSSGPVLKVANGGTAATTASGARTSLGLGTMATQDASAVAITGGTAVVSSLTVSAAEPSHWLYESDADTDEKYWRFVLSGGLFYLQAWNDAIDASSSPIAINRTGTTIDAIALTATSVTVNGNAVYHAGNLPATSGTFTANLRATDGGTVLTSGTATWKKFNGVVTLLLPQLIDAGTATTLYVDSLPADIRVTSNTYLVCHGYVDGVQSPLRVQVVANDDILFITPSSAAGFNAASATKGILQTVLTWVV